MPGMDAESCTQESTYSSIITEDAVDEECPSFPARSIAEVMPMDEFELPETHHLKALFKCRKWRILSALAVAFAVGFIVAVVLLTQKSAKGISLPAQALLAEIKPLLSNESLTALNDPDSPQSLSLQWLLERSNFHDWPFHRQVQRFAMATIYYATGGPSWSNGGSWLSDESECMWVQDAELDFCGENGSLRYLSQSGNVLIGKIPDEIRLLTSLTVINLQFSKLSGTIPVGDFGYLTSLQGLVLLADDVFTTGLSSYSQTLPSELGYLTALTELSLRFTDFSGTLPSELGSLTALTLLSLESNSLTGTIPSELGALTTLTSLSLDSNSFTGTIPSELGALTALNWLSLYSNSCNGTVPSEFGSLTALTLLSLYSNAFKATLPSELGSLTALTLLSLDSNSFTGTIPSELGALTALKWLSLYSNSCKGTVPTELGSLTALTSLSLESNSFTGPVPSELGALTTLTWFSLYSNSFQGTVPSELGSLTALISLSLESNSFTGTVPSELGALTALTWLSLFPNSFNGTVPSELVP